MGHKAENYSNAYHVILTSNVSGWLEKWVRKSTSCFSKIEREGESA